MDAKRNLELKARDHDRQGSLDRCASIGAEDQGMLQQLDTYFAVSAGRLKLREEVSRAELIFYERADESSERASDYLIAPVAQPQELKAVLAATLGTRMVVEKARRLFLWRNVRIHLDTVQELGEFIELEALGAEADEKASLQKTRIAELREALEIEDADLLAGGYADLLAVKAG